ncbi:MAG: hypothetical protein U1E59_17330 [Amaricoccus sp.]
MNEDLRKVVAFIGTGYDDNFVAGGTGFFVGYDGVLHLVTAKHVAVALREVPFVIRLNRIGGGTKPLTFDQASPINWRWYLHPDPTVDVAVLPVHLDTSGADFAYINEDEFLGGRHIGMDAVTIGDVAYTVGLFRLMAGKRANLPVVHSGAISLLPSDELVPVQDWEPDKKGQTKYVQAYLVEQMSLNGLSGAPVFVRASVSWTDLPSKAGTIDVLVPHARVALMGLWQGAWDAEPDAVLALDKGKQVRVPVGMGVVVPMARIKEVLDMDELRAARERSRRSRADEDAASLDSAFPATEDAERAAGDELVRRMLNTKPKRDG